MRAALCNASTVSRPASPGATIFGPPLNPAKKWGSTKPVVMRTSDASQVRFSSTGTSPSCQPSHSSCVIVAGVVVDHPDVVDDITEHGPQLGRRVPAMGSGGHQHGHVLQADDPLELLQDGRDHEVSGLRSGAVAHRDGDGLTGPHQVAERRAGHGPAQGRPERPGRIGERRLVGRLHHRQVDTGRQLDGKPAVAVGQTHLHRAHPVRLPARSDSARASARASRPTDPPRRGLLQSAVRSGRLVADQC